MNKSNQKITFQGKPLRVSGREIHEGDTMPPFKLTGVDMSDIESTSFKGKVLVLSVVPSLDTPTCSLQTKRFNQEADSLGAAVQVLTVSMDLPFAQKRWCGLEGATKVMTGSDYKYRGFGETFGVLWTDMGLLARAVFVIDKSGIVQHVEYVASVSDEPDYAAAIEKVKELNS